MSVDTVLARKWRPRQFSEVVGQEAVVRALSQALTSGRLHHAYLFTGTRGVGKTTLARIFAKALNCRDGLTAEPCQDDIAQQIDEGRFVDLIEIDAASRTKVEDTRELLDNVQYAPSVGRFKIYIIDEVHMLSTHSFNALLKTLEEPPAHVKFLLATTDPHKLPVTILSRCLQFHLKPMTPAILETHMANVLNQESIGFDLAALALIARMGQGSVRDALSLLDQAIVLGGGYVGEQSTREMLGLAAESQLIDLMHALASHDQAGVLAQLQAWQTWGADFDRLQQQLLALMHELAMLQSFPMLAEEFDAEKQALSRAMSPEQLQIWLQVALLAQEDMRLAPTAQMGFELMLMRLLHFRPSSVTPSAPRPHMQALPSAAASTSVGSQVAVPLKQQAAPPVSRESVVMNAEPVVDARNAALAALGIQKTAPVMAEAQKKTLASEALLVEEPAASETEVVLPVVRESGYIAWSIDRWLMQIKTWRLDAAALQLAHQTLRLESTTDTEVLLATNQRGSVEFFLPKLVQALQQIDPHYQVKLVDVWQSDWQTPDMHAQAVDAAYKQSIKASMQGHPRFQQLSNGLSLQANWAQLTPISS